MTDDDLERLLADSFDRQARAAVGDRRTPPAPRFLDAPARPRRHRVVRVLAPLTAAAAVIGVVIGIAAVQHGPRATTSATVANPPGPPPSSVVVPPSAAVHVALQNAEHAVVGVGMPVIAYFSKPFTDARELRRATTLTVNGKPATGAWYFERTTGRPGYPLEGHFRMTGFWPADSTIHLGLPIQGLAAGGRFAFDDNLSLDFATGAAQIVTVDDAHHDLVLRRDGKVVERAPVSLGATSSPTLRGTKVIIRKDRDIPMSGPGYSDPHVDWTQQLTYSGEYLHAAPWNTYNISHGIDTSNGCTNLMPRDAARLYQVLRVGDVVQYPNATGPLMSLWQGYGDWNLGWSQWLTGGAVPTR